MKKFLIILAFAILTGVLLSGCGLGREICPAYTDIDTETEQMDTNS